MSNHVQLLADIIITAAEGGVNYWGHVSNYHYQGDPADYRFTIRDREDPQSTPTTVTLATVEEGICRILDGTGKVNSRITEAVSYSCAHPDDPSAELDAGVADAIIQVALLGELTYA